MNREGAFKVFAAEFFKWSSRKRTTREHHIVNLDRGVANAGYDLRHRIWMSEIGTHKRGRRFAVGQLVRQRIQLIWIARSEDQLVTSPAEGVGDGDPQAACRPDHKDTTAPLAILARFYHSKIRYSLQRSLPGPKRSSPRGTTARLDETGV